MSKDIANVGKSEMTFVKLESEVFSLPNLGLDPANPMPSNFTENWNAAAKKAVVALKANTDNVGVRFMEASGGSVVKYKRWHQFDKPWFSKAVFGSMIGGPALVVPAGLASTSMPWVSFPIMLVATPLMFACVPLVAVHDRLYKVLESAMATVEDLFAEEYEKRVVQWAQKRYGVSIPAGAWAEPSERVAKDIVYLGMKDGEDVFCFTRGKGWIIGYRDGTELPVLAKQKELVEA